MTHVLRRPRACVHCTPHSCSLFVLYTSAVAPPVLRLLLHVASMSIIYHQSPALVITIAAASCSTPSPPSCCMLHASNALNAIARILHTNLRCRPCIPRVSSCVPPSSQPGNAVASCPLACVVVHSCLPLCSVVPLCIPSLFSPRPHGSRRLRPPPPLLLRASVRVVVFRCDFACLGAYPRWAFSRGPLPFAPRADAPGGRSCQSMRVSPSVHPSSVCVCFV